MHVVCELEGEIKEDMSAYTLRVRLYISLILPHCYYYPCFILQVCITQWKIQYLPDEHQINILRYMA